MTEEEHLLRKVSGISTYRYPETNLGEREDQSYIYPAHNERSEVSLGLLSPDLDMNESDQLLQQDQEVLAAHGQVCKCHRISLIHSTWD